MSTYYYAVCDKCRHKGGFASGGNKSMKGGDYEDLGYFVALHAIMCGCEYVHVTTEHDQRINDWDSVGGVEYAWQTREQMKAFMLDQWATVQGRTPEQNSEVKR